MTCITIPYPLGYLILGITIGLVIRAVLCPASTEADEPKVIARKPTTGRLL